MLIRKGGAPVHSFSNFIWTDADGPEISSELPRLPLHNMIVKMRTGRD